MGFKCKFRVGDYVKLNQKGIDKISYRWRCPDNARIIEVRPYTESGRTRYEYDVPLVNIYTGVTVAGCFKSWELDLVAAPFTVNIEELI